MRTSLKQLLTEQTKYRSYREMIKDISSKNALTVRYSNSRTTLRNFDKKQVEEMMDEVLRYLFLDRDFYHNYVEYDYKNEYKHAIEDIFFPYIKKDFKLLKKLFDIEESVGEVNLTVKDLSRNELKKLRNVAFNTIKKGQDQELIDQWKEYQERR